MDEVRTALISGAIKVHRYADDGRCPDAVFGVLLIGLVFWWTSGRFGLFAGVVAAMLLLGSTNLLTNHGIRDRPSQSISAGVFAAWQKWRLRRVSIHRRASAKSMVPTPIAASRKRGAVRARRIMTVATVKPK